MAGNDDDPDTDDYTGPVVVEIDGVRIAVDARLRGGYQPIDGIYRWYGRLAPSADLDAALGAGRRKVEVHTEAGSASAVVGDRDFWGRQRVVGRSRPPYRIAGT